jgi:ABC-type sugar transport system ATPase subunit
MSAGSGASAGEAPVLEVEGLSRAFPGVVAVDDVSFSLAAGEIVGLVGPNGAGKSTLIKMLAGAVHPDSGTIKIGGEVVSIGSPLVAADHGLAFVHQELADIPELSVAENVLLGLGYPRVLSAFLSRRALRRKAEAVLARLEFDVDVDRAVGSLSIAQRRMVLIARGLAQDARVLVLDEPTASLTPREIDRLHELIRRIAAEGVGVIYVSHRLDEIMALTERVVVMRGSRRVADERTSDLTREGLVEHITGQSADTREAFAELAQHDTLRESDEVLLRLEDVSRDTAVEDVSFSLHAGEVLGVAGLVGAGRTELARLIYGADRMTGGQIYVEERPVTLRGPRDALEAKIVLLPEDRRTEGVIESFSIRENVTLPSLPRFRRAGLPLPSVGREREAVRLRMDQLAILAPDEETPVMSLSGGNQQKVLLARWLEHGARIFVFDEPTHGVDIGGKLEIYALVNRLAEDGNGVIFISSEFEELVEVSHRVLVMREGRLTGELTQSAISAANLVAQCYAS